MGEDEGLRDLGDVESGLPRIVVEGDKIIVEEGDWVARDVADDLVEEFLPAKKKEQDENDEKDLEELFDLDLAKEGLDGVRAFGDGVFEEDYKSKGFEGNYEEVKQDIEYRAQVVGNVEERPEDIWGKRSNLEMMGFRDEEAEKKRASARFRA